MLQQLNLFLIECDDPILRIGEWGALSWTELAHIVGNQGAILWDRQGEIRLLPRSLLADTLRLHQAHEELTKLGRSSDVRLEAMRFTRGQTRHLDALRQDGLEDLRQMRGDESADCADNG